ncbi:hypothetical protein [Candidatus Nucleicultrix amoebiphila]|jgi:hypothetical protein|uniref:Uncharacterized protein n=1 Tax=Candidatus Nucleicultrix amoebiphila FS5 TaxID=1414854 RepID=A0A1W6N524_9PROT|nr:hypothetical protein [Candidatus Nucleicultrix amoebiphila]ARN84866.1 hypothetical protein GQ61_05715 [Candidatus Nucleicultrix amoebiphila FS5]
MAKVLLFVVFVLIPHMASASCCWGFCSKDDGDAKPHKSRSSGSATEDTDTLEESAKIIKPLTAESLSALVKQQISYIIHDGIRYRFFRTFKCPDCFTKIDDTGTWDIPPDAITLLDNGHLQITVNYTFHNPRFGQIMTQSVEILLQPS